MPGLDTRPLPDPLVGGLDALLEPGVGDDPRWERRADAADGGVPAHGSRGYRNEDAPTVSRRAGRSRACRASSRGTRPGTRGRPSPTPVPATGPIGPVPSSAS